MIRSFLIEELKRTFLPGVGVALLLTVLSFLLNPLLSRTMPDAAAIDIENVVNSAVVFAMAFLTSAGASTAFGMSFRQGPLRLLENLPIPRHRIWLSRLLVCLLTTVASCGLLVAAHPTVITSNRADAGVAIASGFLLFLGGLCLGMLVQAGAATVILLNLMTTIPLFALVMAFTVLSSDPRQWEDVNFGVTAGAFGAVLLIVAFLVFMRGEFEITRRRLLNGAVLSGALLGILAILIVCADLGVLAYGEEWVVMRRNFYTTSWRASQDGRFLALVLQKERHRPITKVVIVDVMSGNIVKAFQQSSVRQVVWTKDDALIVLSNGTVLERFLGLGTGMARATRVFPDEQKILTRRRSEWTSSFRTREWGTFASLNSAFLLERWEGLTSLIHLDAPGGAMETVSVPWRAQPYYPQNFGVTGGHYYHPYGPFGRYGAEGWIIGEKIHSTNFQWGPFFLPDEAARKEARTEFWENAPSPRTTTTTQGAYVWSDNNTSFDKDGWVYFLEANTSSRMGRLLARRKSEKSWKEVVDRFPLSEKELLAMSVPSYEYSESATYRLWTGFYNGIVVGISRSAEKSKILVVNLVNGERWDFDDDNSAKYLRGDGLGVNIVQREGSLEIQPIRVIQGHSISLPISYLYTPGSAPIRVGRDRLAFTRPRNLAFEGPDGVHVYSDPAEITFTSIAADGRTTRQLWPQ